jgi:hypothetical protein
VVRPPRPQMGMRRGERKRSSAGGRCTALRHQKVVFRLPGTRCRRQRGAVQPNPNSERANVALYVRGQRSPAKWNCAVTQCGSVVGTALRGN